MLRHAWILATAALALSGACLGSGTKEQFPDAPGKRLSLAVAPLSLPAIQNVCYDIFVKNGASPAQTVFSKGNATDSSRDGSVDSTAACSTQYGDSGGGDITYIGPCDAATTTDSGNGTCRDENRDGDCDDTGDTKANGTTAMDLGTCIDNGNGTSNSTDGDCDDVGGSPADVKVSQGVNEVNGVTLFLDGIQANGHWLTDQTDGGDSEFQNPCPEGTGCFLSFTCQENEDTPVTFNLVVLRDANQGFFDAVVTFEDVFCSGKLDTVYDTGPIELLYVNGQRVRTAVLAYACTGGTNDTESTLYAQGVKVTCANGNGTDHIDFLDLAKNPEGVQGNGTAVSNWSVTRGVESLDCGAGTGSCKKVFASLALAIETDTECNLTTRLAASGTDNNGDNSTMIWSGTTGADTPSGTIYPYILVDNVQLKNASGWLDFQAPLGSANMTIGYTTASSPVHFCARIDVNATASFQSNNCTVP